MKLLNIKSKIFMTEGHVDPYVMMPVQQVVQRGYAKDVVEFITIARLLLFFKAGAFYQNNNFYDPFTETSKELLDMLKALQPDEMKELATQLLGMLMIKDKDELQKFANPSQDVLTWIKYVTSRSANN